ncbi:MAG: UDP-N-acetylmuramoyl-L-alanyl-D-glutamate--2,6-diaminopimelate ligase [Hyphomicrobiales bacterium]|nr:UDP-N-acetylmuramoyl-L-alanyl-D-glutamate--2,6-diaminopimelate ligase [Hyphomicrobiales bacterium]
MLLGDLLAVPDPVPGNVPVAGLALDSRKVAPGFVFFAVPGTHADGSAFAEAAVARGAVAIVAQRAIAGLDSRVAQVIVEDVRTALAAAAARFYQRQPGTIVAVTGTSGKTSIAEFTRQIWAQQGLAAASLGTLGVVSPKGPDYGSLTTPDPISLHQRLAQLADEGVTHLAMEASSHGLDQHRLDGVRLSAAGFSNLSRDHLDYHDDFVSYLNAKMRLFEVLLEQEKTAVIDADSTVAAEVMARASRRGLKLLTTGRAGKDLILREAVAHSFATDLVVGHGGRDYSLRLPLAGAFQVANALVAAGLALATGAAPDAVMTALGKLRGAPGRLDHAGSLRGAEIFIDYAHKPDALAKVLETLRPLAKRRLLVVFGCGGDRDPGKRPMMGEIAMARADDVIITDDNPRSEDPATIRAAILAGAPGAREIGDRAAAIGFAIKSLQPGDILLVAGKGHETGQIVGGQVLPFSDHDVVASLLKDQKP